MTKFRYWSLPGLLLTVVVQAQESATPVPEPYQLNPGDTINVSVWKEPELQRDLVVRPDGRFSFPLVGDVVAVGKSVAEVREEMVNELSRYIPEAVLTVSVKEVLGNKIYVIGQVKDPGEFVVNPMVDVVQALSMAGGMTPFASVNDILILRRAGGEQTALRFRYGEVEKGRNLNDNIVLQAGDIVVVP
jgi:polysaccharide export outer membrane protein